MASGTSGGPLIEAVLGTRPPYADKPIKQAVAGTTIRIVGQGFGKKPDKTSVVFGDLRQTVFSVPFSDSELFVTCPLPAEATETLTVQVGKKVSEPWEFAVHRPSRPDGAPGDTIVELFREIDQYVALTAMAARNTGLGKQFAAELSTAADLLDGTRATMQRNVELLMQFRDIQSQFDFEPLRSIERMDESISNAGLIDRVRELTDLTYGATGFITTILGGGPGLGAQLVAGAVGFFNGASGRTIADIFVFLLKEGVKLLDLVELVVKVLKPSASAGAGVEGDVTIDIGEGISALAKGVDIVAQLIEKLIELFGGNSIGDQIGRLEAKVEMSDGKIGQIITVVGQLEEKADRAEDKLDRQEGKLDAAEQKLDRQESKLDRLEEKSDVAEKKLDVQESKLDRAEGKLDRLEEKSDMAERKLDAQEGKLDRSESKLDRVEEKLDITEQKLDRHEGKLDRTEGKLDRLEGKADTAEEKLDRHENKLDRVEGKLDQLESKADRAEQKLDRQEGKADRAEQKLDRQEGKLDQLEHKADRAEQKLDRHEGKLDRLEQKSDRSEQKLDRQEGKLDQLEGKSDRTEQKLDRQEGKLDQLEGKADRAEQKLDRQEGKLDRLEGKSDRAEEKLDKIEEKLDRIEEKKDREEEKLDRLSPMTPQEASVANQRGGGNAVTAAVSAIGRRDNRVYLRGAVAVDRGDLDVAAVFSPWILFDRPANADPLVSVSLDLQYEDNSDSVINAFLSTRDRAGRVFHRAYDRRDAAQVLDPAAWTQWQDFLDQP